MNKITRNIALLTCLCVLFAIPALASDLYADDAYVLEGKAESVTIAKTKNGNPYTRIIMLEERTSKDGIKYNLGVPAMAFGEAHADASQIRKGQTFRALVLPGSYNGKSNYQIVKIVD